MDPTIEQAKQDAAQQALKYVGEDQVIGVGTGSTVNYFIEALAGIKGQIAGAVASSEVTAKRLQAYGIPLLDLNGVDRLPIYIDGADEVNNHHQCIKGGGGALTREKIIASVAEKFIVMVDARKQVRRLGTFPLAIEVLPMARSHVAREIVKLGGSPIYRDDFITDNGGQILDIHDLVINEPIRLEQAINNIPGVLCHGLFALRPADVVIVGS